MPAAVSNFALHTAVRWVPMALSVYLGKQWLADSTVIGVWLLASGAVPARLELAAQVMAVRNLRSSRQALELALGQVRDVESAV